MIGKLEAVFIDGNCGYLQLTHYRGSSLTQHLTCHQRKMIKNENLELRMTSILFSKISQTLAYIHDHGIIHGDINVSESINAKCMS